MAARPSVQPCDFRLFEEGRRFKVTRSRYVEPRDTSQSSQTH